MISKSVLFASRPLHQRAACNMKDCSRPACMPPSPAVLDLRLTGYQRMQSLGWWSWNANSGGHLMFSSVKAAHPGCEAVLAATLAQQLSASRVMFPRPKGLQLKCMIVRLLPCQYCCAEVQVTQPAW